MFALSIGGERGEKRCLRNELDTADETIRPQGHVRHAFLVRPKGELVGNCMPQKVTKEKGVESIFVRKCGTRQEGLREHTLATKNFVKSLKEASFLEYLCRSAAGARSVTLR